MNSGLSSHKFGKGSRTERDRVNRTTSSVRFVPQRHSHVPTGPPSTRIPPQRHTSTINQRHLYLSSLRHPRPPTYGDRLYGTSSSAVYYDRIRMKVCFPAPTSSADFQFDSKPPASTLPVPTPRFYDSESASEPTEMKLKDDLLLHYTKYTMDALIKHLVPSDTRRPTDAFIHAMLMCSRLHIRPSLLLNKLSHKTIARLEDLTHGRGVRVMQNFLYILLQWTAIFPYDFRDEAMISQVNALIRKINTFDQSLKPATEYIDKELRSKLQYLRDHEEYIRQLNQQATQSLTYTALSASIVTECSTPVLFAQQVTHIELDRLQPIGAEELLQYFIMKAANEEARTGMQSTASRAASTALNNVHDTKSTIFFEAYVQWFNRLTYFVATEIVKNTQRASRTQVIDYFLYAAHHCLSFHNFNSMFAIIGDFLHLLGSCSSWMLRRARDLMKRRLALPSSGGEPVVFALGGLNMQPVKRLKRTWEKQQLEQLEQLERYKSVAKNFAVYRQALRIAVEQAKSHRWQEDDIVIPFTSLICQDVYFIKTRIKDNTPDGGINLQKYYALSKFVFEEFIQAKQSRCSFARDEAVINYIITSPTFPENALLLASFECEPAATARERELQTQLQNRKVKPSV